jgi:hypothetical protein
MPGPAFRVSRTGFSACRISRPAGPRWGRARIFTLERGFPGACQTCRDRAKECRIRVVKRALTCLAFAGCLRYFPGTGAGSVRQVDRWGQEAPGSGGRSPGRGAGAGPPQGRVSRRDAAGGGRFGSRAFAGRPPSPLIHQAGGRYVQPRISESFRLALPGSRGMVRRRAAHGRYRNDAARRASGGPADRPPATRLQDRGGRSRRPSRCPSRPAPRHGPLSFALK